MTFFSVIIPTYNRAHLITETINSVLAQSYSHFEVIIVDDGSKDDTKSIIEKNYGLEARVRYFYKQNEERGAARNYGLKQAKGDYAVFFDSDDWMKNHYLETLNKVIKENSGIFLLAGKYDYDNSGKNETHPVLEKLVEGFYNQELFLKGNILACNYCIRIKERTYLPFPEERELASMEDWLFLLENLEGKQIFIKDAIVLTMRQHDERSMQDNQKVIKARQNATSWALRRLHLDDKRENTLIAWSHYFCGVHQYLDHKKGASIKEAFNAIRTGGINFTFFQLLIKSILGRRFIKMIK